MTFTGFWSWHGFQAAVIPFEECLSRLVRCAGGNGNLLMNIGPMPTGEIDPREADRLQRIGQWLSLYGQSIYGTRGGPFEPGDYGVSTQTGDCIYVHVLKWPQGALRLPALAHRVVKAEVLNGKPAEFKQTSEGLTLLVKEPDRMPVDTVIALKLDSLAP